MPPAEDGWYPLGMTGVEFVVIEAFEDDIARLEWHTREVDVPRAWLPTQANVGDHLRVDAKDGTLTFRVDEAATTAAREANQAALNALNAGDKGGDVDL